MRLIRPWSRSTIALLVALSASLSAHVRAQDNSAGPSNHASSKPIPGQPEQVPAFLKPKPPAPEPTTPPARPFHDSRYGVSFTIPPAWNVDRKDGDVSTFRLDARNAAHTAQMRAVATISFNPHPTSTFSGALFYYSVIPNVSANQCAAQAIARAPHSVTTTQVAGVPFTHGYDEHGGICTESRDEIYTTEHGDACYRFDAVINSFCGGDVSGVRDITDHELDDVRKRMQSILNTIRFDN
jgi:hypothetical protein